jgi:hypothetical protein
VSSFSVVRPTERMRYWTDNDDADATTKHENEALLWTWDLDKSGELASGETVSSAAYEDSGVTRSGAGTSATTVYATVTGLGEFKVTVTLSTGRKLVRVVRFYAKVGSKPTDYR